MDKSTKKINQAVWIILISNIIGGVLFVGAYFVTGKLLVLIAGIFIMVASIVFYFVMQNFINKITKGK